MITVQQGNGTTEYGPGVSIDLDANDVSLAIEAYLVAKGIHVRGARTITMNDELCPPVRIYVDPGGFVVAGGKRCSGRDRAWPTLVFG